jgi:hypothetical protein
MKPSEKTSYKTKTTSKRHFARILPAHERNKFQRSLGNGQRRKSGRTSQQTSNNKHPTGGPACLGDQPRTNRPRWLRRSLLQHQFEKSSRFVGCRGRTPGLSYCSVVGTARPLEVSERSEHRLRTNMKGQGLRCLSVASPWHPQAGAGKTHTTQHTKTTRVSGVGQALVHPLVQALVHPRTPSSAVFQTSVLSAFAVFDFGAVSPKYQLQPFSAVHRDGRHSTFSGDHGNCMTMIAARDAIFCGSCGILTAHDERVYPLPTTSMKHDATAATKGDLNLLRKEIDQKIDQKVDQQSAMLRQDMKELKEDLVHRFELAVEIIKHDLFGATFDRMSVLQNKNEEYGRRIQRLENLAGVSAM